MCGIVGYIGDRHPGWTLTIVGDGPEMPAIRTLLAADAKLGERVSLPGQLGKPAIASLMNRSSFLVLPSERETFGLVVAEAMACGLPVIIGDTTGATEFVDADDGIKVPAGDTNALAAAMDAMIASLPAHDPARVRARIVESFGFEAFGARMRDLYHSVA